jgi:hypothetical protein
MKFILSQYLRTLKERDEFDRLLPDLLLAMGYVPISKAQAGVRQHGVDLAAVGVAPEDGVQELLLCVIKRGDIGRSEWDSGPQSVRQSLNEIFDVYLTTHVEPAHESLRKKIVLATTGDLKQDTQINWDSYAKVHSAPALLEFWSGDRIAILIDRYMLNEHIFRSEDRTDIRRSLALAGEPEYDNSDLHRLFRRQIGLNDDGQLLEINVRHCDLVKALRVIRLSLEIFSRRSEDEGNVKQALIASERAVLWSWHRIQFEDIEDRRRYYQEFGELWRSYNIAAFRYFRKLHRYLYVQDGLSGCCRENAEFSMVVFEQIGIISSIGLCQLLVVTKEEPQQQIRYKNAAMVADAVVAMLNNNPVSGSPRLDINVVDIVLGLILLVITDHIEQAQTWLTELVMRIDYTLKTKRNFPICTDSIEDLVEISVSGGEDLRARLMRTSWLLPTLAGWSVILERNDLYEVLAKSSKADYPEVCLQLWHPTAQDFFKHLYFSPAQNSCGESEAPIILPDDANEYRTRMKALLQLERHNIVSSSTACKVGLTALDLLGCRHFRIPVAPFFWYRFLELKNSSSQMDKADEEATPKDYTAERG